MLRSGYYQYFSTIAVVTFRNRQTEIGACGGKEGYGLDPETPCQVVPTIKYRHLLLSTCSPTHEFNYCRRVLSPTCALPYDAHGALGTNLIC